MPLLKLKPFEIIKKYNIRAQKKLGQNFLIDSNVKNKICDALDVGHNDYVLEIGPGFGALTETVLGKCKYLWAVERDPKMCHILEKELLQTFSNFSFIHDSILNVDISDLIQNRKIKVLGNLPYYITSKIIFKLIEVAQIVDFAVLTMQKEVADRLMACPGSKTFGRLSAGVQYFAKIEKLFDIKPQSFFPQPDVISSVVKVTFTNDKNGQISDSLFLNVVEALFQERRKNIHNGLCLFKGYEINKDLSYEILDSCEIAHKRRAESLSVDEFVKIAKAIEKIKNNK